MQKINFIFFAILIQLSITLNNYKLTNIIQNKTSITADLEYKSSSPFTMSAYNITPIQNPDAVTPIKSLQLKIDLEKDLILHITIKDKHNNRFQPNLTDPHYINDLPKYHHRLNFKEFGIEFPEHTPDKFTFNLTHNNNNKNTTNPYLGFALNNFLFSDNLIVFDTFLTSDYIFGFGERNTQFQLTEGRYTIWPNDTSVTYRDEKHGGYNLMGHQPIGLHKTADNLFLGFVFMNTNAQDIVISNLNDHNNNNNSIYTNKIEYRTIGGIIDLYITQGNTPDQAIMNIHSIIGRPIMPPFWSLGWHHCRWGYRTTSEIRKVYFGYKKYNLPIDGFWGDIDILFNKRNFVLSKSFSDLPSFVENLHKNNKKFIPIVDYGIPATERDIYYTKGLELNAFILSNYTKQSLLTAVWPGMSVFPDIFSKNGLELWKKGLTDFDKELNYDGIWLDMNEPAMIEVHKNGQAELFRNQQKLKSFPDELNKYKNIPYVPGYRYKHSDLTTKSISLNAYSSINDPANDYYTMYNVKPLISLHQIKATNQYLTNSGRRPFILSRSNTIGHGKYAFHWLGDNVSTFNDIVDSIAGIFNYNIFGVPMTGADICGFHGNSKDELCARWHVLGAFYPFSRNHNEIDSTSQEPWKFEQSIVLDAAKVALPLRYSLLRYFYSQLFLISIGQKGSFFKPLFFEFINDKNAYDTKIMNSHIMVGSSLLFIPNLNKRTTNYQGYFPNANWNSFPKGSFAINYEDLSDKGTFHMLNGNFNTVNLFLRGGSVIPYQNSNNVLSTEDLRNKPIEMIINPNEHYNAEGHFFYDNNDVVNVLEGKEFFYIKVHFWFNTMYFTVENKAKNKYKYKDIYLSKIKLLRKNEIELYLGNNLSLCEVVFMNGEVEYYQGIDKYNENVFEIDFVNGTQSMSLLNVRFINIK